VDCRSIVSVSFALALLFASVAQAQVPGPADPGRVEDRFKPPPTPQSAPPITVPGPEVVVPPDQASLTRFNLAGVVVEGATVYQPADFEPLYRSMLGKEVSLLDIYNLRDAITAKYRADGYILSQAIIPPQEITGGIVRIQIVEGYIGDVKIEGEVRDRRGLIPQIARRVMDSRPLRLADLERSVLLISDLPGIEVNTVLRPSPDKPGAADLIVIVKRQALGGSFTADNRGSVAIGPEQFSLGLEANSILGLNEQTAVQFATAAQTDELRYVFVRHDEILNADGVRLSLTGSVSRSRPGGALAPLDPLGRGETWGVRISAPFIRSRSETLIVGVELSYLNSSTDLLGVRFSEDRVRFIAIDASYDFADTALGDARPAVTLIRSEFSHGLDILDSTQTGSPGLSRANGVSDFTKLNFEAFRVQSITPRVSLAISAAGQISSDALLSSQQFGLGGARFGRGYEPSELTGDQGASLGLEARYSPPSRWRIVTSPQFYSFYETGMVWLKSPLIGEPGRQSLASAGVGFRFSIGRKFTAEFELAKPLTRAIASRGDKDVRPIFAISTRF
jgi:hemolysin activation/secretion protein